MYPNMHIHEKLMFERQREVERALEQRRLLSSLPRRRQRLMKRLAGKVGGAFMAVVSSLQQFGLRQKPVMPHL